MDDCVRDPQALNTSDSFVWSGRTQGFIAKTIFYKEETANIASKPEIVFFQDFGLEDRSGHFRSIDESGQPEMTMADLLEHGFERLAAQGLGLPTEPPERKTQWTPVWPPMLHLVEAEPEWRSVDFEEDARRRRERLEREDLEQAILRTCKLCRLGGAELILADPLQDYRYIHAAKINGKFFGFSCDADIFHVNRGTVASRSPSEGAA